MNVSPDNSDDTNLRLDFSNELITLGLSPFSAKIIVGYISNAIVKDGISNLMRLMDYIDMLCGHKKSFTGSVSWRRGCPEILQTLQSRPVWTDHLPEITKTFEENYEIIRQELLLHLHQQQSPHFQQHDTHFQPYLSPKSATPSLTLTLSSSSSSSANPLASTDNSAISSTDSSVLDSIGQSATDSGEWKVCYLYLHGMDFQCNIDRFPNTISILKSIPRLYDHSLFSSMTLGTHITPHVGPTNKKLRCMLPICIPPSLSSSSSSGDVTSEECWLRVADEVIFLQEGKCIIFDDSYEHEAGYRIPPPVEYYIKDHLADREIHTVHMTNTKSSDKSATRATAAAAVATMSAPEIVLKNRIVFICDIWHPDFTDTEVRILQYMMKAQMRSAMKTATLLTTIPTTSNTNINVDISSSTSSTHTSSHTINIVEDTHNNFITVITQARALMTRKLLYTTDGGDMNNRVDKDENNHEVDVSDVIVRDD